MNIEIYILVYLWMLLFMVVFYSYVFVLGDDGYFLMIKRYFICCSIFRFRSCLFIFRRFCKSFVFSCEEVEYICLWGWCFFISIYGGVMFFFRKFVNEEWYKVRMWKVLVRIVDIIVK